MKLVVVVMGSSRDNKLLVNSGAIGILDAVIGRENWQLANLSADRHREALPAFCRRMYNEGTRIFICAAGLFPILPSAVASLLPGDATVIGVPLSSKEHAAKDSLVDMVDKPKGASTVIYTGVDELGLYHAAKAACGMLAPWLPETKAKLKDWQAAEAAKKPPEEKVDIDALIAKQTEEGGTA